MSAKDWVDQVTTHLYSRFILRDFSFLSGGSAFLLLAVIMLEKCQVVFSRPLNIVFFFGAAYFVGLLMQEVCIYGKVFRMTPGKGPEGSASAEPDEYNWPLSLHELHSNIHPAALVALERTAYLKQVAACIGAAALFSALFALIHGVWLLWNLSKSPSALHYLTFLIGVGILLFCRKENQLKTELQYKSVRLLRSRIEQKVAGSDNSHGPENKQ
ncbi:hypothetical protein ES702_05862 [subsurface metagenome]